MPLLVAIPSNGWCHRLTRYCNALLKVRGPIQTLKCLLPIPLSSVSLSTKKVRKEWWNCSLSCRKDKQLTLKKLVKLQQIVGFLSEKYNDAESEEVTLIQFCIWDGGRLILWNKLSFAPADKHGRKLQWRSGARGNPVDPRSEAEAKGLDGTSWEGFPGAEKCLVSRFWPDACCQMELLFYLMPLTHYIQMNDKRFAGTGDGKWFTKTTLGNGFREWIWGECSSSVWWTLSDIWKYLSHKMTYKIFS